MTDSMNQVLHHHGEFYFEPSLALWKEQALKNHERVFRETYWGQTAQQVRTALKLPTDRPLIFTGHQPIFFHPGIWAKNLAASVLAESIQGAACHKLTDTALVTEYTHVIPEVEEAGQSRRRALEFFTTHDNLEAEKKYAFAFLPPPEKAAFQKILEDGKIYAPPLVKEALQLYEEHLMKGLRENKTWNEFHIFTLRLLDEICGTQRSYFEGSRFWKSEPFLKFVANWLTNLPSLTDLYNQSLNEYRLAHHIKHEITPMPNLKFEDWWFELPFWGVNKYRQRYSAWAKSDGHHLTIRLQGSDGVYTVALKDFLTELRTLPITLWPKALPQTLFCRLYLSDYFIHGLGGGAYEEVNNIFFEKVFKSPPLDFGTVTATWWVEPEQSLKMEEIMRWEERIRAWQRTLSKNPEYLITKSEAWKVELPEFIRKKFEEAAQNSDLKILADEKKGLIESLKDPAKKSEASKRIGEINGKLTDQYGSLFVALEVGLADIEKLKKVEEVLTFRGYPFFCYAPKVFIDMKKKLQELFPKA
jgi:hypothetical protein